MIPKSEIEQAQRGRRKEKFDQLRIDICAGYGDLVDVLADCGGHVGLLILRAQKTTPTVIV